MMVPRRVVEGILLWLALGTAVLVCCVAIASRPGSRAGADATEPLPTLPMEVRGPSVKEAIERLNHRGPEWISPPDVVDPDPWPVR
jgi:hypothetical protein